MCILTSIFNPIFDNAARLCCGPKSLEIGTIITILQGIFALSDNIFFKQEISMKMQFFILSLLVIQACSFHPKSDSTLVKVDGFEQAHEIAFDSKSNLYWNLVPLPQNNYAE